MAAEIREKYGIEPKLISSGGGVFEVTKDSELIFSKKAVGRFPTTEEIFDLLD